MLQDGDSTEAKCETCRISNERRRVTASVLCSLPSALHSLWTQMDEVKEGHSPCNVSAVVFPDPDSCDPSFSFNNEGMAIPASHRRREGVVFLRSWGVLLTWNSIYEYWNMTLLWIHFFFHKTWNLGGCLTICQAAGTQECDNQEEIHSDLLVQKMKSCNQKLHYTINNDITS